MSKLFQWIASGTFQGQTNKPRQTTQFLEKKVHYQNSIGILDTAWRVLSIRLLRTSWKSILGQVLAVYPSRQGKRRVYRIKETNSHLRPETEGPRGDLLSVEVREPRPKKNIRLSQLSASILTPNNCKAILFHQFWFPFEGQDKFLKLQLYTKQIVELETRVKNKRKKCIISSVIE